MAETIEARELMAGDVISAPGMLGRAEVLTASTFKDYRVCSVRVYSPDGNVLREGRHWFRDDMKLLVERPEQGS